MNETPISPTSKWCDNQSVDELGKVICLAHLAEARVPDCPYKSKEERASAKYPCSDYMARTKPSDEKIAKRFLEFYHTGQFNTNVALDDNAVLIDGYSAYLVAQKVGLTFLPAIYKEV